MQSEVDLAPSSPSVDGQPHVDGPSVDACAPCADDLVTEVPESFGYRLKTRVLGPPLHTEQLAHERLGIPTALAVFSSDCISSSAYATEQILTRLIPVIGIL